MYHEYELKTGGTTIARAKSVLELLEFLIALTPEFIKSRSNYGLKGSSVCSSVGRLIYNDGRNYPCTGLPMLLFTPRA